MESDRYVCEICNQGFQRDQNLQMHRRRHKVPWKLLKRETPEVRKRVFVCPEPTCLHHDPCHALGDLVGIKKHFRRKHSSTKQWTCEKCSKGYAVQSDYKAHLKTCGTRGHSCDCGRVFSRVESFIEHQDNCIAAKEKATLGYSDHSISVRTSSPSRLTDTFSVARSGLTTAGMSRSAFDCGRMESMNWPVEQQRELQLMPSKQQAETSQAPLSAEPGVMNPDNITLFPSPSPLSSSIKPNFLHSVGDESTPMLQLSIGLSNELCTDSENKSKGGFPDLHRGLQRQSSNLSAGNINGVFGTGFSDGLARSSPFFAQSKHMHTAGLKLPIISETENNLSTNDVNNSTNKCNIIWPTHKRSASGGLALLEVGLGHADNPVLPRKTTTQQHMEIASPIRIPPEHCLDEDTSRSRDRTTVSLLELGENHGEGRTSLGKAWPGIATKEQPRHDCGEAQGHIVGAGLLKEQAREELRLAAAEKAYAEHARQLAKRQLELAEVEIARAKRMRQEAQVELDNAQLLKDKATRQIDATRLEITCQTCRQRFQIYDQSRAISMSSSIGAVEGAGENDNRNVHTDRNMRNPNIVPSLALNAGEAGNQEKLLLPFPAQFQFPAPSHEERNGSQQVQVPFSGTVSSSVSSEITSTRKIEPN
eukprot:Gb_41434 [translate_table: standard]